MHVPHLRHRRGSDAPLLRPHPASDPHPSSAAVSRQASREASRANSRSTSPKGSAPATPDAGLSRRKAPASAPAAPQRPLTGSCRQVSEQALQGLQGLRTPSPVLPRNIAPALEDALDRAISPAGERDSQVTVSVAWGGSAFASPLATSPAGSPPQGRPLQPRAPQVSPQDAPAQAGAGARTPFDPVPFAVSPRNQSYLEYSFLSHLPQVQALRQMARGGSHTPARGWAGQALPRQDLDALYDALVQVTPPSLREDWPRTRGALEVLLRQQVGPQRLAQLARSAQVRDLLRTVPLSLLTYACGFMLAALASGWLDPQAAGAAQASTGEPGALGGEGGGEGGGTGATGSASGAQDLLAGLLAQGLGNLIIGAGGEWASAVWRASGLGQAYTRAEGLLPGPDGRLPAFAETAEGRWVQATSAISFAIGYIAHTLAEGGLGPAHMRLAWGAGAAALAGLYREAMAWALAPQRDPLWIDGSSHARQAVMTEDIRRLESPLAAAGQGLRALGEGMARATGQPGREALARAALRSLAAGCARAVGLVGRALGRQHELLWAVGADAWLGLSWGLLSTLPTRGSAWMFAGPGRARVIGGKAVDGAAPAQGEGAARGPLATPAPVPAGAVAPASFTPAELRG